METWTTTESLPAPETHVQKIARLRREIAERQAELARLILGDPAVTVEIEIISPSIINVLR